MPIIPEAPIAFTPMKRDRWEPSIKRKYIIVNTRAGRATKERQVADSMGCDRCQQAK
jgi:hypothetical protein